MFWDNEAAELLLLERYPWFLDTWRSYPRVVHRGLPQSVRHCELWLLCICPPFTH